MGGVGGYLLKLKIQLYMCLAIILLVLIAAVFVFIDNSMESMKIYTLFKENNSTTKYTQRSRISRHEINSIRDEIAANEQSLENAVQTVAKEGFSLDSGGNIILGNGANVGRPHPQSGFTLPFDQSKIPPINWSSGKGVRNRAGEKENHQGFDFGTAGNKNIEAYAVAPGEVVFKGNGQSSNGRGYGNSLVIKHDNGLYTLYAHGSTPSTLNVGDKIPRGALIFVMGGTSYSTTDNNALATHLHLEVFTSWTGKTSGVKVVPGEYLLRPSNLRVGLGSNTSISAWPATQ